MRDPGAPDPTCVVVPRCGPPPMSSDGGRVVPCAQRVTSHTYLFDVVSRDVGSPWCRGLRDRRRDPCTLEGFQSWVGEEDAEGRSRGTRDGGGRMALTSGSREPVTTRPVGAGVSRPRRAVPDSVADCRGPSTEPATTVTCATAGPGTRGRTPPGVPATSAVDSGCGRETRGDRPVDYEVVCRQGTVSGRGPVTPTVGTRPVFVRGVGPVGVGSTRPASP